MDWLHLNFFLKEKIQRYLVPSNIIRIEKEWNSHGEYYNGDYWVYWVIRCHSKWVLFLSRKLHGIRLKRMVRGKCINKKVQRGTKDFPKKVNEQTVRDFRNELFQVDVNGFVKRFHIGILSFFQLTTIHGVGYLTRRGLHFIER